MPIQKQVAQFKDGQLVAIYESANEAAEAVGSINSSISKCCLGKRKEVNGFTFQYTGKSNAKQPSGDVKCPYCNKQFKNYNGLTKHIFKFKQHGDGITQEQLLTDYKYDGDRPTCKCGCGEYTEISYEGGAHFRDYLPGHHLRVHNNWGHNPKAIQHSAETRRRQYQSGERIQWNKGKSWKETYTDEQIQELMKMYTKERGAKISAFFKGVPKTEEHKQKLKEVFNTDEYREKSRKNIIKRINNGTFSLSSEVEKVFIHTCIEPLGIEFNTQYYIKDIHHYCDVFIPSKNIIVEFQGDYWHGNPKKYLREELTKYQLDKVKKDEILRDYCQEHGLKLIEVWESDFKKDRESVKKSIRQEIGV